MKPRVTTDECYWRLDTRDVIKLYFRLKQLNLCSVEVVSLNPREDRGAVAKRLQRHLTRDLHIPVRIYDNGRGFTVSYTPMINTKAKVEIPLRLKWVIQAALPRHNLRRFEFCECL